MTATVDMAALGDAELLQAAVTADAFLVFDAAKAYGFTTGGPEVDVERCEHTVAIARERGLAWTAEEVDGRIAAIVVELLAEVGQ